MKKCIRLPKSEYNVVAWCREPVHFFVEPFFFLGSNESIPPPGSLFQQKVIAGLSLNWNTLTIKKGKEKRNVEQKGQLKKQKEKGRNKKRKQRKKKRQIKHGIDGIQNKIRNQSWFGSEFNCV